MPLVSVFIRVRDEAQALGEVLRSLHEQRLDGEMEVVVLDNESADESARVAVEMGARVFTLPRALFGYGRALNLGVELCRGEIVVLLSAHSIPQTEMWLSELVEPLRSAGPVGAAFCRQVPHTRVSRHEMQRFECFPRGDTLRSRQSFIDLCTEGADPYEAALFSSSACAIRREVALSQPFRELLYAEDRAFVVDYLFAGGEVVYLHKTCVSYERRLTFKSAYRTGYRAQVSKRLIRELSATYLGQRFSSARETRSRLLRAALVVPTTLFKVMTSLLEPPSLRRRAILFALRSSGASLGLAKGTLFWRRHLETLNFDNRQMELSREQCLQIRPKDC